MKYSLPSNNTIAGTHNLGHGVLLEPGANRNVVSNNTLNQTANGYNGKGIGIQSTNNSVSNNLRSQLHFSCDTGQIWLHEHRMLLVHADSHAQMRRELIETLGRDRARGLLMRMGYASGMSDFELVSITPGVTSDLEAFTAGPLLHTLEGIVKTIIIKLEINRKLGKFYVECSWENSWEAQAHLRRYGEASEAVCWNLIGYASGFTSAFMLRTRLVTVITGITSDAPLDTLLTVALIEAERSFGITTASTPAPMRVLF